MCNPPTPLDAWPALDIRYTALEEGRAVPHAFIRSALFSSRKFSGKAVRSIATESTPIYISSTSQYVVEQVNGERLDQGDGEVYAWLLNRSYQRGLEGKTEARVFFTREEALSELGRERGTQSFKLFDESLRRLYRADITYQTPYASGRTRLVSAIERPTADSKKSYDYEVVISAKAGDFFQGNDFKILLKSEREGLTDYLSKWLHAFYSSHRAPFEYFTSTIKQLSDRESTQESKFQDALGKSLKEVKRATNWRVCEVRASDAGPKVIIKKGPGGYQPKRDFGEHI